jgi:zinc transport system ATP-binding protein
MGRLHPLSRSFGPEDKAAVERALEAAEIADLASRSYSELSGGQRRRVLVARALASLGLQLREPGIELKEPGILILDEPTSNMDAESENRLFTILGKLKGSTTILIVTHERDFVSSLVDRVLCMGVEPYGNGNEYSIVQHRLETIQGFLTEDTSDSPPCSGKADVSQRILHEKSFPGDTCYPEDVNGQWDHGEKVKK